MRLIAARGSAGLPALAPLGIEPRMLLFAAALSIVTTLLFGLAPALRSLRLNLTESLRDGAANASAGLTRHRPARHRSPSCRWRSPSLLLLGAGLMMRSLDGADRTWTSASSRSTS